MKKQTLAVALLISVAACGHAADFIKRSGRNLVVGNSGAVISLRGICFGNKVWFNPAKPPYDHHGEIDYERVKAMRMNVVRFYMNYRLFEDDARPYEYKKSGWEWLDENIAWAKKNGIYLILNMHVPQGGFQSGGEGMALWDVPENQKRFIALWKAIAARYKDEPIIAGFDILNEPYVSKSADQWQSLAEKLDAGIREADKNHLVIVEQLNMIKNGDWHMYTRNNFFIMKDPDVMYTFHFYAPFEYTHQYAPWTELKGKDGGKYPDRSASKWTENKGMMLFDSDYLEECMETYLQWGADHNVPLYMGEFGLYKACFENGRNGVEWVRDVVDLAKEHNVNFTYHDYHESGCGLYRNDAGLPDENSVNKELLEYFSGAW